MIYECYHIALWLWELWDTVIWGTKMEDWWEDKLEVEDVNNIYGVMLDLWE